VALFATTLYAFVAVRLARPLDHQLRQDLAEMERSLLATAGDSLRWQGSEIARGPVDVTEHPWFELWDERSGLVLRRWPFTENRNLILPPPNHLAAPRTISVFSVAPDLRLRTLTVPLTMPGATVPWLLRLIRVHQPHADALPDLQLIIFVTLPMVVALLVVGGYFFTRRCLLPLDRMATEARRISAEDLRRRLPVANPHDELGRLAGVFNVTLDRLQKLLLGAGPLRGRRLARAPRAPDHVAQLRRGRFAAGPVGGGVPRHHRLDARGIAAPAATGGTAAPAGQRGWPGRGAASRPGCTRRVAGGGAQELGILAEQKNQHLVVAEAGLRLRTDPVLLRQALQNLIDNAIKYGPPDSEVRVSSRAAPGGVLIEVADEGPGISEADRAHLTRRFFRTDRSRGRASGGFGLGLAITKAYLRALGGSLEHEPRAPRGSIFRLRLPDGTAPPEPRPRSAGNPAEPKLPPAAAGAERHPFPEPLVPRVE